MSKAIPTFEFEEFVEAFGKGFCRVCGIEDDIWRTDYGD